MTRLTLTIIMLTSILSSYAQKVHVSANIGHEEMGDVCISESGKYIATSYGSTKLWDAKEGYLLHDLTGDVIHVHEAINSVEVVTLDHLGTIRKYVIGEEESDDEIKLSNQGFISATVNEAADRLLAFTNLGWLYLYNLKTLELLDSQDMGFQGIFDYIDGDIQYTSNHIATGVMVGSFGWLGDLSNDSIKSIGMYNINAMDIAGLRYDAELEYVAYWDEHGNGYIHHIDSTYGDEVTKDELNVKRIGFWDRGYYIAYNTGKIWLYNFSYEPIMQIRTDIEDYVDIRRANYEALVVIGKKGANYQVELVATNNDETIAEYTSSTLPTVSNDGKYMFISNEEDLAEDERYHAELIDLEETTALHSFPMGWSADKFTIVTLLNFRDQFQAVAKEGLYVFSSLTGKLDRFHETEEGEETWFYLEDEWADHFVTKHDSFTLEEYQGIHLENSKGERAITLFFIQNDPNKWIHIHPSGLFDASPEAMNHMYWVKGLEVIEFNQLKARYWLPGLWEKVVTGERLPEVADISTLKLQPEVELGKLENGKLPIKLIKREGGYGAVSIFINGKEVASDIRGSSIDQTSNAAELSFSLKDHPYLQNGENIITVKAASEDGSLVGRGISLSMEYETMTVAPSFYGVIVGVSDYANDKIDLKYPVKDAEAIRKGLQVGASNLFGADNTTIYSLSSESELLPTKKNFEKVFSEIASKAKAEDVIFVYLSGHGISWGQDENTDFYFLTADALSANREDYSNVADREATTVSTTEMVEWLKKIAALKQLMVLDACGSGAAVDNLIASRNVEASQLKAIDRMKDRTGMYVISGCAADAVSYEASKYGQGLLTYAILEGLNGIALKDGKYIDVFKVMDYARERVPELAEDIGGIQRPQLLMPTGGSFDIGLFTERDTGVIKLPQPKKVMLRSSMVNTEAGYEDTEGLRRKLDDAFRALNGEEGWNYIFFDTDQYTNACKISGGYTIEGNTIIATIVLRCGEELQNFKIEAEGAEEFVEEVVGTVR